jgi:hypothetical protein
MAEHDGAGYPIAYCLLSTATSIEIGKRTKALNAWASRLRDEYGIYPDFCHLDKDMGEIGMARGVWKAKLQLCWWHMRKAIRERLAKNKLSTTPYHVARAQEQFAFIDPHFRPPGKADMKEYEGGLRDESGSDNVKPSTQQCVPSSSNQAQRGVNDLPPFKYNSTVSLSTSLGDQKLSIKIPGKAKQELEDESVPPSTSSPPPASVPPSISTEIPKLLIKIPATAAFKRDNPTEGDNSKSESCAEEDDTENRTFCPEEYRQPIVNMIESHFCAHPLIPGYSHPTPAGIREWAVREMYEFCVTHDLREVWAYLWENWYRQGRWELWARAECKEIPILKTTMIMESQ